MSKTDVLINNKALDLMELSQMSGVEGFIAEDSIDWKIFHWFEAARPFCLLRKFVKHLWGYCCSMCSQDIFSGFFKRPTLSVSKRILKTLFMCLFDSSTVVFGNVVTGDWIFEEESIVHVSGRMTLRLEERIEVPERTLHKLVCWHFIESHFK